MKILISAYACEPGRGSEEGKGWNFPLSVAKLGHEVWVLTSPYTSNYSDNKTVIEKALNEDSNNIKLKFSFVDIANQSKVLIKKENGRISRGIGVYLHYLLWQRRALRVAKRLDEQWNFDVIHHVNYGSLVLGSELWRLGKPFIFGPVGAGQVAPEAFKDFFLEGWKAESRRTFIVKNLSKFNFLAAQTVRNADLVLVENQETLQLLNQLGGAKRTKLLLSCGLPSSYFTDAYPLRPPSPTLNILWVARLFPRKGLRLALQALSLVSPTTLFKMTILGDGPLTPYVQHWIKEFRLEDKVEHRGQVPWLDVKKEYLKNDVFLFSSLRDTFGSQLLEAMVHGLPIVTLDHHGAKDFLPDSVAIKVPVENPADTVLKMAQAVEYLANNPEERIRMGIAGYSFVQSFSWDEKAKKMALSYRELASFSGI